MGFPSLGGTRVEAIVSTAAHLAWMAGVGETLLADEAASTQAYASFVGAEGSIQSIIDRGIASAVGAASSKVNALRFWTEAPNGGAV
jgi:hypothetical protein